MGEWVDVNKELKLLFVKMQKSQDGTLRERLRTHKVFTKDQCFYLNYHKFSIKSYVLDVY